MMAFAIAVLGALLGWMTPALANLKIAPYKDHLFAYPEILGTLHDGDFIIVDFDQARDVDGRDEIPLKKAFDRYVELDVSDGTEDVLIRRDGEVVQFLAVGRVEGGARMAVIYLHGMHGDRTLAMEDFRFGGNFNRLKNLMVRNGGVYVSPDFSSFGAKGEREVRAVMNHIAENSPEAPIFVACASTGCKLVLRLLADPESAELLDGVILHGALPLGFSEGVLLELAMLGEEGKKIPVYFGHGSSDETVPWVTHQLVFEKIKALDPDYPVRFELFKGPDAVHGTPIRMMDWRAVLNWMLAHHHAVTAAAR